MPIKGSLKEASLPDVIQLLHFGRRTGCLALADRQRLGSIYFADGWITYAVIVNRRDRLGDVLLHHGMVTREQLDQALQLQQGSRGRRVGEILVNLGAITAEQLRSVLRSQVEEAVYELFSWTSGTFTFESGVKPDWEGELERINPENLLLEGARRVDEWSLIAKKISSFDLIFSLDKAALDNESFTFTEAQRRIIPLLDGKRDVQQVIHDSGLSEFEGGQALFGLITAGIAHRAGTSSRSTPSRLLDAQIEDHRNLGIAFLRAGMLDEAVRELRRVMELRPSEGSAPFYLGVIAARQNQWQDAVNLFRQALDRGGPRGQALHNLAVASVEVGRIDQSETLFSEAAGRIPDDPLVFTNWALLGVRRGDPEVALARLDRAAQLFGGKRPPLWFFVAVLAHAGLERLEKALEMAREGVALHPDHPVLKNNLAVLLEARGELSEAETILNKVVHDEVGLPQPWKNLGDIFYRSGRYEEATKCYDRAASLDQSLGDDLFFKLGNLAFRNRDASRARECWERALDLNPGHQLARANLDLLPVAT